MSVTIDHCQTCNFFNNAASECRRYAPQPQEAGSKAQWPSVAATDWCGEYEPDADKTDRKVA